MILTEIRPGGGAAPIGLHPRLTVVTGLDPEARGRLAEALGRALRGAAGEDGPLSVQVVAEGAPQPLTPELARRLGLHHGRAPAVLWPSQVPGARPVPSPEPEPDPEAEAREAARAALASAEAAQALAASTLTERQAEVEDRERALARAREALAEVVAQLGQSGPGDSAVDPAAEVVVAEAALDQARGAAEVAARRLDETRRLHRAAQEQEAADRAAMAARIDALNREQAELVEQRAQLVARLAQVPEPGDVAPVEEALAALRRLRAVKPRASPEAQALKDRWTAVRARVAELGQQGEPPESLVGPALAALQQARDDLARAEAMSRRPAPNQELVSAAVTAHAEVLAAEQKAMRRGTRLNRRKVEQAREAESEALGALGLDDYSEFLRRFGGPGSAAAPPEGAAGTDPVAAARAALADAEAVWDELHQGRLPAGWPAAKEEEAEVRAAAHRLVGREVADDDLEALLDEHREAVVDTGWAAHELGEALVAAGGRVPDGVDVEEAASQWLAQVPEQRRARSEVAARLSATDGRLRAVGEQLAGYQADAFFAADVAGAHAGGEGPPSDTGDDVLSALEQAHRDAETGQRRAEEALVEARRRRDEQQRLEERRAGLEAEVEAVTAALEAARAGLAEAVEARDYADRRVAAAAGDVAARPEPPPPPPPPEPPPGSADLAGVLALEAELFVLARLVAARGPSPGDVRPLVVDAGLVAGLPAGAGARVLGLLERATAVQLVVLGEEGGVAEWAERLGEGAAVRSASPSREPTRR